MILLPEVSAAQASDPGAEGLAERGPAFRGAFVVPRAARLDASALVAAIEADLAAIRPTDARAVRAIAVRHLGTARQAANRALEASFRDDPLNARGLVRAQSNLTDALIAATLEVARRHLHPVATPTEGERLAVIAVGGYGRAEMAPHSDVDLMFLTPWKLTPWAESVIESMLYILWDIALHVGHATRTVTDCVRLARADFTVRTALLEHRFLAGHAALAADLDRRLWTEVFAGTGAAFIEAKLAERAQRHRRHGQRYVLEPNVKEGKGGLRDLQTLYWIAKYLHRVEHAADLVAAGMFLPEEYARFNAAETFLWAVRCHLHYITRREMDLLTFDLQVEVAERMGYEDHGGRRGVEHFMQDYFLQATRVGELTRVFLTALEAQHVRVPPLVEPVRGRRLKPGYAMRQNRLAVADPAAFLADKLNLLRVFDEAMRTGLLLHPDAMRLLAANLGAIDEGMQTDREAGRIFLDLLLNRGNPERALRRMNELGLLGAFIPEFQPIVAMMQFNHYHHFTVDEHIIQCISTLAQIERGELVEELPIASRILKAGVNRRVLYVATLLHDIGKGRAEDHSVLGAQIARRVAPRLGLPPDEAETVEWLVRTHLLMSDMAQKRDLADPRTIRDFAKAVKSRRRLDLLTVLTVCDIRGVGPGTWNNWKAMLLRQLYRETARALETGLEDLNRDKREAEAKRGLRTALAGDPAWDRRAFRAEAGRHYGPYWQGLPTETHVIFARLLRDLPDDEIRIDLEPDPDRDATRACFALVDHPGIFSRLAGALALVGANVVDARTYTSKDGYATAVFWLQDAEGSPYEDERLPRLRRMIARTFRGEVVAREALRDRDKLRKRDRQFRFPTSITFDNEGSEIYTLIEVDTRDRPALLFDLARTLAANSIYIASAVIATYGAQVVDTFYVKDMFGLKLHTRAKQETLERRLREAIAEGAERARGQ